MFRQYQLEDEKFSGNYSADKQSFALQNTSFKVPKLFQNPLKKPEPNEINKNALFEGSTYRNHPTGKIQKKT